MEESGDRERSKLASDSGYSSNKSNSNCQSQRSSGSSKSQHSSLSSRSSGGFHHQNSAIQIADYKSDRKSASASLIEKNDQRSATEVSNIPKSTSEQCGSGTQQETVTSTFSGTPCQRSAAAGNLDGKALQMAALTHALCCIKKFQQEPFNDLDGEFSDSPTSSIKWNEIFSEELKDDIFKDDGFAAAVSIDDGAVVFITSSITNVLGFPKDMLIGRSFMDFIHPKDRTAFASHITCGIKLPFGDGSQNHKVKQVPTVKSEQFFCRLRQYRGLNSVGFGVTDKTVVYFPFKLTMKLKQIEDSNCNSEDSGESANQQSAVRLVIVATRIKSAYQYPEEVPTNPGKFVTRHSASCQFGHMDADAISYLGHLPQDLIGNSVLDYYHPEDMEILKDIYQGILHEQGKPFRSRPYRFRVFNGSFATLETDWSCFINPWSWKLEFVIGQHRVIQGPGNPNVFMPPTEEDEVLLSEDVVHYGKETQEEIKMMLAENVNRHLTDPIKQHSSRRRKVLAAVLESLLEQIERVDSSEKSGSQCSGLFSVMERDSVMLGEISPHHDDCSGSNESSETPPSYTQLNYKENIERFFQSQPKTSRSDESGDMNNKIETQQSSSQNRSSDDEGKNSPQGDCNSGSNRIFCKSSNDSDDRESFDTGSMILTEDVLSRHNEDMEKYMIKRHRELRCTKNSCGNSQKECRHKHSEKMRRRKQVKEFEQYHKEGNHGVKRTGSSDWDKENETAIKHPHLDKTVTAEEPQKSSDQRKPSPCNDLWPPFSMSLTPSHNTTTYCTSRAPGTGEKLGVPPGTTGVTDHHYYKVSEIQANTPVNAETLSSRPTLFFVPGQQNFIPQQVQYAMQAGVVLQPIAFQVVGQSAPILMPNILSPTVLHQPSPLTLNGSFNMISEQTQSFTQSSINMISMPTPIQNPLSKTMGATCTTVTIQNCSIATPKPQKLMLTRRRYSCPLLGENDNSSSLEFNYQPSSWSNAVPNIQQQSQMETPENSDFQSSSDGFGSKYLEESNSSSNSLSKNEISEDGVGKTESQCTKDGGIERRYMSESEAEGDQEMMWASHEKTELAGQAMKEKKKIRSKVPPWMENVNMTEDIVYRYELPLQDLSDILQKDLKALNIFGKQSGTVNEQLDMLYKEVTEDQSVKKLDNYSSESNCSDDLDANSKSSQKINDFSKLTCFHEEKAPFPFADVYSF